MISHPDDVPKTISDVKDSEKFSTMKTCCYVLYGRKGVVLTSNSMGKILWIQTNPQFSILLGYYHHRRDPQGWFRNWS